MEPTPTPELHLVKGEAPTEPAVEVVKPARLRWAHAVHSAELVAAMLAGAAAVAVVVELLHKAGVLK